MTHKFPRTPGRTRLLSFVGLTLALVGAAVVGSGDRDVSLAAERSETKPAPVKAPEAQPEKAEAGATKDATFDDIKLDLKKGDPYTKTVLTDKVKKLDGKSIRIRGYIFPSFQQSGIKQFVLMRDNQECCFGPGAALFDAIVVEMTGGATTDYSVRPVSVEGTFTVKEMFGPDGKHLAIYHLDGKAVKQ
jgi:hypothetical protein